MVTLRQLYHGYYTLRQRTEYAVTLITPLRNLFVAVHLMVRSLGLVNQEAPGGALYQRMQIMAPTLDM
jgi:hypothetical protein